MPTVLQFGPGATDRGSSGGGNMTLLDGLVPALCTDPMVKAEIWATSNMTGCKIGSFYGSGTSWTNRAYATIGSVTSGSKQTFTGLNVAVSTNDIIGMYSELNGFIENDSSGGTSFYKNDDQFDAGTQTYTSSSSIRSLFGEGADLNMGSYATNRGSSITSANTILDGNNPANVTGTIEVFEIWAAYDLTGCKAGSFSGTGTSYDDRDYATLGSVTSGSKQTFSGLSIDASEGDFVGMYYSSGDMEIDTFTAIALYYKPGDQFGTGSQTYTKQDNRTMSLYAEGTAAASGWTGKISGVTDPSKIDNTDVADIIKWDGIS